MMTPQKQNQLMQAVYIFLAKRGFNGAAEAFALQADLSKQQLDNKSQQCQNILQKKWKLVLSLSRKTYQMQDKIKVLQRQNEILQQELKTPGNHALTSVNQGLPSYPEKFVLKGHMKPVTQVIFHPIFSLLLSASEDGSIKIWDYQLGKLQNSLKGHTNHVTDISFDRQGKFLASSSKDMTIRIWNTEKWNCQQILAGHQHMVNSVEFIPPNFDQIVTSSTDKTIRIWDLQTGHCKRKFQGIHQNSIIRSIANDTGTLLASCGRDEMIVLWSLTIPMKQEADSGSQSQIIHIMKEHSNAIQSLAFANPPCRKSIVSSQYYQGPGRQEIKDQEATIHDSSGGQNTSETSASSGVSKTVVKKQQPQENKKLSIEDRKEKKLAEIRQKLLEERKAKEQIKQQQAAVGGEMSGKMSVTVNTRHLPEFLASGGRDCLIKLWQMATGKCVKTFEGHQNWITQVFFHPNGKYLLSSSDDHTVRIWDLIKGRCFKRFEAHQHFVTTISINLRYPVLATGSPDNTIKVWGCR